MKLNPPILGISAGFNWDNQPAMTTDYMLNTIPIDQLESRMRLGQRPGLDKVFDQQIGGGAAPIVEMLQITVVD